MQYLKVAKGIDIVKLYDNISKFKKLQYTSFFCPFKLLVCNNSGRTGGPVPHLPFCPNDGWLKCRGCLCRVLYFSLSEISSGRVWGVWCELLSPNTQLTDSVGWNTLHTSDLLNLCTNDVMVGCEGWKTGDKTKRPMFTLVRLSFNETACHRARWGLPSGKPLHLGQGWPNGLPLSAVTFVFHARLILC